ncbi:Leucine-rich repeat [Dillenia turbinata]|uniref:Leucine-rich repeat n=1 Tax=Dillenia turbinata TaxID=194707 RepID=A0AAN8ZJW4_9MAGN
MEAPTLVSLTMEAIKNQLVAADDILPYVYEFPWELFDYLLTFLPPLALEKVQQNMRISHIQLCVSLGRPFDSQYDWVRDRKRHGNFNEMWETLFKKQWPERVSHNEPVCGLEKQVEATDEVVNYWQQMYWETHLQNCLSAAAEAALLPLFSGCISEIIIPNSIIKHIDYNGLSNHSACEYSKLYSHCQRYGIYARTLTLHNVLCVPEICVDGLCILLNQNRGTLTSIEFIHCHLTSSSVVAICGSLKNKAFPTHGIQHFAVKASRFMNPNNIPAEFISFLSSGSSLDSLSFCESHFGKKLAKVVFRSLFDASSGLSILDLSDNKITGWLSFFSSESFKRSLSSKSLPLLRVLNLRGNQLNADDAGDLGLALDHMPNLETLDISDNPIEDQGIRSLIPYLYKASARNSPFCELKLENCALSTLGVTELLQVLFLFPKGLKSLSIADNNLGSHIAQPLAKYLRGTRIKVLNLEDNCLGPGGFEILWRDITPETNELVSINMSKNRGGTVAAKFLAKLISLSPDLVTIDARYNFMTVESLMLICSALEVAKGKLGCIDLRGNVNRELSTEEISMFSNFQHDGKPIMIVPAAPAPNS